MRKFGIIAAILCLASAALFLLWPHEQAPPEETELTVTDSTGRSVTLPAHPQRVVLKPRPLRRSRRCRKHCWEADLTGILRNGKGKDS